MVQRDRGYWIEYSIPVIISEADYLEAARIRSRKLCRAPKEGGRVYILRGLIRCGECGGGMLGQSNGYLTSKEDPEKIVKRYNYYRCLKSVSRKDNPRTCGNPYIKADAVENLVTALIREFSENPNKFHEVALRQVTTNAERTEELRLERIGIETKLAAIEMERSNIIKLAARELITDGERVKLLGESLAEMKRLAAEMESLDERIGAIGAEEEHIHQLSGALHEIRERIANFEPGDWARFLPIFIKSVVVHAPEGGAKKGHTIAIDGFIDFAEVIEGIGRVLESPDIDWGGDELSGGIKGVTPLRHSRTIDI